MSNPGGIMLKKLGVTSGFIIAVLILMGISQLYTDLP